MNPGAPFTAHVDSLRNWSLLAQIGLAANAVVDVLNLAICLGSLRVTRESLEIVALAPPFAMVLTTIFFLRWIHLLVRGAKALGASIPWRAAQAVTAFFIPFVSLVRPYQILRDTQYALAVDAVVAPPPRMSAAHDYRNVQITSPAPPKAVPAAHLGLWWGFYLLSNMFGRWGSYGAEPDEHLAVSSNATIVADGLSLVSAVLAVLVVRRLTALLDERYRRISHSTHEELEAQRIRLHPKGV